MDDIMDVMFLFAVVNNIIWITFSICTLSRQYTVQTGIETHQHDNTPDAQYRATY